MEPIRRCLDNTAFLNYSNLRIKQAAVKQRAVKMKEREEMYVKRGRKGEIRQLNSCKGQM